MTVKIAEEQIKELTNQISAVVKRSDDLCIPISIAFEFNKNIELFSNNTPSDLEGFSNIKTLHESQGCVPDFLLALCKVDDATPPKLNKIKSNKTLFDFTLTNPQVLISKH